MGQAAQHQAAIMRRLGCLQSQPANSTALAGSRAVCHSGAKHDRLAFNLSTLLCSPQYNLVPLGIAACCRKPGFSLSQVAVPCPQAWLPCHGICTGASEGM